MDREYLHGLMGTVYNGEWKDDQMWGRGEYKSASGISYAGTFRQNTFWAGTSAGTTEAGIICILL